MSEHIIGSVLWLCRISDAQMPANTEIPVPELALGLESADWRESEKEQKRATYLPNHFVSFVIYSVRKHPLSTYEVPGIILDTGNPALNKTDRPLSCLCFSEKK